MSKLDEMFKRSNDFQYWFRNVEEFRNRYIGKTIGELYHDSMQCPSGDGDPKFHVGCYVFGWDAIVTYDDSEAIDWEDAVITEIEEGRK